MPGVGGEVTLSSMQKSSSSTLFTLDLQRQDGGKGLLLQVSDDGIIVEASIQVEAFEKQPEGLTSLKQPFQWVENFV